MCCSLLIIVFVHWFSLFFSGVFLWCSCFFFVGVHLSFNDFFGFPLIFFIVHSFFFSFFGFQCFFLMFLWLSSILSFVVHWFSLFFVGISLFFFGCSFVFVVVIVVCFVFPFYCLIYKNSCSFVVFWLSLFCSLVFFGVYVVFLWFSSFFIGFQWVFAGILNSIQNLENCSQELDITFGR